MAGRLWVAQLLVSEKTRNKIVGNHEITEDEVRAAVECVPRLDFVWNIDPERGERAIGPVSLIWPHRDGLIWPHLRHAGDL